MALSVNSFIIIIVKAISFHFVSIVSCFIFNRDEYYLDFIYLYTIIVPIIILESDAMLLEFINKYFDAFYKRFFSVTRNSWKYYVKFQPTSSKLLKKTSHPIFGQLIRWLYRLEGKNYHTQGHILPLNKSLDKSERFGKSLVTPADLVKKAVNEASYRIILDRCLCRDGFECKDYPRDLGCLMLGEACRHMVDSGIAREITEEEALAFVDKAADLGMVSILGWAEYEAVAKGISEEDHTNYFEICFCCPCCCLGLKNYKYMHKNDHMRFIFKSIGWRAQGTAECTGCGKCVKICPMECISITENGISVRDDCIGCGLCSYNCPSDAIVMKELEPIKENILDYFWGIRPTITKIDNAKR